MSSSKNHSEMEHLKGRIAILKANKLEKEISTLICGSANFIPLVSDRYFEDRKGVPVDLSRQPQQQQYRQPQPYQQFQPQQFQQQQFQQQQLQLQQQLQQQIQQQVVEKVAEQMKQLRGRGRGRGRSRSPERGRGRDRSRSPHNHNYRHNNDNRERDYDTHRFSNYNDSRNSITTRDNINNHSVRNNQKKKYHSNISEACQSEFKKGMHMCLFGKKCVKYECPANHTCANVVQCKNHPTRRNTKMCHAGDTCTNKLGCRHAHSIDELVCNYCGGDCEIGDRSPKNCRVVRQHWKHCHR